MIKRTIPGELVYVSDQTKEDFAEDLKSIHRDLMEWVNRIHMMNGPARVEMANAVIEVRHASGYEVSVNAAFFLMDIKSACEVMMERLKG